MVCASSYLIDFNRGANVILAFTMALTILSLILGIVLARHFIRSVTRPIGALLAGMRRAESCREEQGLTGRNDEIGSLVNGYNELIENITEARQKIRDNEKDLIKLAYHDTLSDLPNRNLFKTKVEADIAAAVSAGMLVVMDIRNFRLINTLQGESVGDGVLRMIGNILKDFQEESRTVGRISGDEFGIWLRGRDEAWLSRSVVMLQSQFASILQDMGYSQRVDVRVGYAMYPDDGSDFEHCYMSASLAVKRAKGMGGNAVVKFDETLRTSISRVEYLKQCLEKAIEEREFRMAYQEKVDPTGRLARSVEALARWVIPGEGPVSPAVFIPIIEEHGMITRFGELILELVMADFDKLRLKYGEDVSVSINVSPIHLFDANFSTKLFLEVRKHLVNPEHVILEITESMQIDDFERMKVIMSKIKEFGVRFSLDDFGTGYSSLSYIFRLPIAELKIDRAFVVSLDTDPNAIVMLGAICQMAKAYGLAIVAEGVETKEQEAYMLAQGVDLIQGYLYSKPEPV